MPTEYKILTLHQNIQHRSSTQTFNRKKKTNSVQQSTARKKEVYISLLTYLHFALKARYSVITKTIRYGMYLVILDTLNSMLYT